ncbi:MAG: hypothetical protein WCP69_10240 [Bacteroidota bacterium]
MNKKTTDKTKLILMFIIALLMFFTGYFTRVFFTRDVSKIHFDNQKVLTSYLKEETFSLENKIIGLKEIFEYEDVNKDNPIYDITNKYCDLILYFRHFRPIGADGNCQNTFSSDEVSKLLEDIFLAKKTLKDIKKYGLKHDSELDKTMYNYFWEYVLLSNFFVELHDYSIMTTNRKCVCIPAKDTINKGDDFEATFYFSVMDLTGKHKIKMENGNGILKNNKYSEKAQTYGLNKRKGIYEFLIGSEYKWYPIEFSFYVK